MGRENLRRLYHNLCETCFAPIPHGRHHLQDIYRFVQNRYPELCDDSYLCAENCKSGHNTPEWQHRVRAALDYLKRRAKGVRPADARPFWVLGPAVPSQEDERISSDIEPPSSERVKTTTLRVVRDTTLARYVKVLHHHKCQICGLAIELPDGSHYAEAHHLQPLGAPHDGPDIAANIVVLCPNHHAMCDYGVLTLDLAELRECGACD